MANIYLKVPWYVAAFYRGRDEEHQLTEWEPLRFNEFSRCYAVMAADLRFLPEKNLSELCYSQRAWQNILKGKKADGGKVLVNRDPATWPTPQEMCALRNRPVTGRQMANDYLCIEIPKEVYFNKSIHRTNSCYSMSYDGAKALIDLLYMEFCRMFTRWMEHERDVCRLAGIKRMRNVMVERFLVQFNILIHDDAQAETLRRMSYKWEEYAETAPGGLADMTTSSFADHVSEEEKDKAEKKKRRKRA